MFLKCFSSELLCHVGIDFSTYCMWCGDMLAISELNGFTESKLISSQKCCVQEEAEIVPLAIRLVFMWLFCHGFCVISLNIDF